MSNARRLAVLALSLAAMVVGSPQAQQPSAPVDQPTFRLRTDAVIVDVIVRGDGKRPVTGLTADDFEIRENGVLQQVTSFTAKEQQAVRIVSTEEIDTPAITALPDARVTPDDSIGDAGVVAIVFDQLTPEARWLAHRAARQFIGHGPEAPGVIGVFGIGLQTRAGAELHARLRAHPHRRGPPRAEPGAAVRR